jgi:hypothetical protein
VLKDDLVDQFHLSLQMEVEEALYLGISGVVTNGLLNFLWQVCNVRSCTCLILCHRHFLRGSCRGHLPGSGLSYA